MENMIHFTEESFEEFKKLYETARVSGKEIFMYQEKKMITFFAGFLIEMVEEDFDEHKRVGKTSYKKPFNPQDN